MNLIQFGGALKAIIISLIFISYTYSSETSKKFVVKARDIKIDLGIRVQGAMLFENLKADENSSQNDFYLRRLRFNLGAEITPKTFYKLDIRNDKVSKQDSGDGEFTVGDAFITHKLRNKVSIRLFRAKVDVSRTQTISSSRLLLNDRPYITDFAAGYVSAGRRSNNIQINGFFTQKLHYHFTLGKGVQSGTFEDSLGQEIKKIKSQSFMYGGKIKFTPFGKDKLSENFFGKGKYLTLGLGYFNTSGITYENEAKVEDTVDRSLVNIELSGHYQGISLQAEYFIFNNMIKDFTSVDTEIGTSKGYYIQGEYFTSVENIAPMFRHEHWNKFADNNGYNLSSNIIGANYYFDENSMKVGIFAQQDKLESLIANSLDEDQVADIIKITTQIDF